MQNVFGPMVRGDQLRFRERDISQIFALLEQSRGVQVVGPRRIGKSSVMQGVVDCKPANWQAVFHSVEDKEQPTDLLSILLETLSKNHSDQILDRWSKVKQLPAALISFLRHNLDNLVDKGGDVDLQKSLLKYWQPLSEGIEDVLAAGNSPVLIVLDELPIYLDAMLRDGVARETVSGLLLLLARWRDRYPHFNLLIGGSVEMSRILSHYQMPTASVCDLGVHRLEPFNKDQATRFLRELALSYDLHWFEEEWIEETLHLVQDYHPFFLHGLFMAVRRGKCSTQEDLWRVFEDSFLASMEQGFFSLFLERLRNHYTQSQRVAAEAILDFIARQPDYKAHEAQLRVAFQAVAPRGLTAEELFYDLSIDEFLFFDGASEEYRFTSKLVALCWRRTKGWRTRAL